MNLVCSITLLIGFIFGNIESDAIEIHAFTEHFLTLFIL